MLYWNTVNKELKEALLNLMQARELDEFRLVGGTALSLHLGHRMSVDIDLFTDAFYGSIDFQTIETMLHNTFTYVSGDFGSEPSMGKSYLVGNNTNDAVKLDIYYSMDPFFQSPIVEDEIRMASVAEIAAMKLDIIQHSGRKKDFWDLHEISDRYTVDELIAFHQQRYEWTHDPLMIRAGFTRFAEADLEPDPICLKGKHWEFIREDIINFSK